MKGGRDRYTDIDEIGGTAKSFCSFCDSGTFSTGSGELLVNIQRKVLQKPLVCDTVCSCW
jgi:hypothetical protein